MSLCLAYDVHSVQDGAGAQIQRIFAVEALSSLFGVGFFHQEILSIDSNYGDGLNDLNSKKLFVDELNQFIAFRVYNCEHSSHRVIKWKWPKRFQPFFMIVLRFSKYLYSARKPNFLLIVSNPIPILKHSGHVYDLIRFRHGSAKKNSSRKLSVKVHLPWAGIGAGQLKDRKISLEWYKEILSVLNIELNTLGYNCTYTFHTDGIPGLKPDMFTLGISPETESYWRGNGLLKDNRFNWSFIDIEKEFGFLSDLEIQYGISPIQVWNDMVEGDILLLANSSLSVVAGLLNLTALKLIPPGNQGLPGDFHIISPVSPDYKDDVRSKLLSRFG